MSTESMRATVLSRVCLTPSMVRIVLGGEDLAHFCSTDAPDEFIWLSFTKPDMTTTGRYFTVRRWDTDNRCLTVDFVKHDVGIATEWAQRACVGDAIEIYLPRSRFDPPHQGAILLIGDYTALPAISRIVEELPHDRTVIAHVEIPTVEDRVELPAGGNVAVFWHESFGKTRNATELVDIARTATFPENTGYVWIAGEAKAVAECRRHFRDICGIDKSRITAVGYWVQGQSRA